MHDFDGLLYDCVRFQIADGLKLEKELGGDGVVVERFAVLGRFFPFGVLGFWPARFEVSVKLDCEGRLALCHSDNCGQGFGRY